MREPTQNQIRKVYAVQRELFGNIDKDIVKGMSAQEVSDYIDKLEEKRNGRKQVQNTVKIIGKEEEVRQHVKRLKVNPQKLGMLQKIVLQRHLMIAPFAIPSQKQFDTEVDALLALADRNEARYSD